MCFDMGERRDKNSSRLAILYMPFVSVIHQLFGDFNSELDREQLLFVGGSGSQCKPEGTLCILEIPLDNLGVRFPPRGRTLDRLILWTALINCGMKAIMLSFQVMIPRECVPGTRYPSGYVVRVYWRLQEFALMQLSGVCFMQVNHCFSVCHGSWTQYLYDNVCALVGR